MVNHFRILILLLLVSVQAKSQLQVSNFYPQTASYQDTVFIVGSGFGNTITDLDIKLGKGKAEIVSVEDKLIKILVPGDATFGPLTISQISSRSTRYLSPPFLPVYQSDNFDFSHVDDVTYIADEEDGLYDLCNCDFDLDGDQDIATVNNSDAAKLTSVNVFSNTTADPGSPDFTRVPGTYFNINQPARNVICGDVDGDGKPELIVSQGGDVAENIYIFRNTSSTDPAVISFSSPIILSTSNGGQTNGTRRLALHDLDGDLLPEIVVTNQTAGQIIIFENESSGGTISFPAEKRLYLPVPANTLGLAVNDIDGDGKVDIVASANLGGDFYVLRNESSPGVLSFADAQTFTLSGQLVNLASGDIDGDGKHDIVLTDFEDGAILLLLNQSTNGSLAFASPIRMNAALQPWGIQLADITGNHQADIIVSTQAASDKNVILKNNSTAGNPNFELVQVGTGSMYRNLVVADFNNDAKPDLAATLEDAFGNYHVAFIKNKSCVKAEISPADPPAICEASPVLLTATAAKNVSYQWFRDGTEITGANQSSYTAGSAAAYTVQISDNDNVCSSTSTVVNVVEDSGSMPNVPDIIAPATICAGETLNLSAGNDASLSYFWSGPSGFESTEISPSISAVNASNAGVYQLEVRQGLCKSAVKTVFIEVVQDEEITLSTTAPPLLCPGESVTLSFDADGYTNIQWLRDGQPVSNANAASYTASEAGTYQVTALSSSSCTQHSNELVVSTLDLDAEFSTDNGSRCQKGNIAFNNLSTVPDDAEVIYTWDFGDGNTSTEVNPVHQYNTAANYTVSLNISINSGACNSTATQVLTVHPRPVVELLSSANFICPNDSVSVEAVGDFSTIQWEDGSQEALRWIKEAGTYTATVTNGHGCDSTYVFELLQENTPQLMIEADGSTSIAVGDSVQLFAMGAETYEWTPGTGLSDSTIANPFAKPLRTTTYTVTGYNEKGCPATEQITITVNIDEIPVDALSIFSPNGDGIEDTWVINNFDNFPECYFTIFDTNGLEVFRSSAPYLNDWEGTGFNGQPLPEGAYYYIFRCKGSHHKASGNVNIIR